MSQPTPLVVLMPTNPHHYMQSSRLTRLEIKHSFAIMSIFSTRMLGMFMVLPVFALHALDGAYGTVDPFQIGIAIGIYGLAQALLQLPFGWLSDHYGRKQMIFLGLIIFLIGSLIAAAAQQIEWVILGRALQGAGAISSVLLALMADLIPAEKRTRAMAIVGIGIGASFLLSLLLAPILYASMSMEGIFGACALLAAGALWLVWRLPNPTPAPAPFINKDALTQLFFSRTLMPLNVGILLLHAVMTALFLALPLILQQTHALPVVDHWQIYIPVLLGSVVVMLPLVTLAERMNQMPVVFRLCILLIGLCLLAALMFKAHLVAFCLVLMLLFGAFNVLEASLPSLVSQRAPSALRGTAMGIYASCQFFGIFLGASIGGWILQALSMHALIISLSCLCGGWLLLSLRQRFSSPC